ncbi:MAG TPA: hypothetical protein VH681_14600, partial [Nitrospiraceae bacterium]
MARFSQPSFLRDVPQPLVLTVEGRSTDAFELYRRIASPLHPSFLLESGHAGGSRQHYSFLGCDPAMVLTGHDRQAWYRTPEGTATWQDPFARLVELMTPAPMARTEHLPPFIGGAVGYLSYDLVRQFQTLPSIAKPDVGLPDLQFALFEVVVAMDHQTNCVHLIYCPSNVRFQGEPREKLYREGLDRLAALEARLTAPPAPYSDTLGIPQVSFGPEQTTLDYIQRVRRCQEYIAAGDIYQANLSHRFTVELKETPR